MVSLKGETESPARGWSPRHVPILIIDDDFAIRRTLAQVLIEEGHEVVSAANGREALGLLTDASIRPGLIILDLWMPSMDGLEFRKVQQSLGRSSDIPVLVMTASRFLPRELPSLGLVHVLQKPLHVDELLMKIAELTSL
jgi:CheY-like chemotaxis protein